MPVTPTTYAHELTFTSPPRIDGVHWAVLHVEQAPERDGAWTELTDHVIDALGGVDVTIEVTDATIERGYFRAQFDTGLGNQAPTGDPIYSPVGDIDATLYATADALRDELDMPSLTDDECNRLIRDAMDRVDRLLGPVRVDALTGRKVRLSYLLAWQREKLSTATVALAAVAKRTPTAFDVTNVKSVSGPDFSRTLGDGAARVTPAADGALRRAAGLLEDAGLRRLNARLRGR